MSAVIFVPSEFRTQFSAFSNATTYPDLTLEQWFAIAEVYINNPAGGCYFNPRMSTAKLKQALYLMTAHLLALSLLIAQGQTPGIVVNAGIDKITVGIEPPPAPNQWQYWLQTTGYGQQLLALLQVASVGGFFIPGGVPGRSGFQFGNGW